MASVDPQAAIVFAGLIDHTLLRPDASIDEIETLCAEAAEYGFFSVCVNAVYVERAVNLLADKRALVCSVVGFPLAGCGTPAKAVEAQFALDRGAREIDMVINLGALKSGADELVVSDVEAVAKLCHASGAQLKVILETCLLDQDQKRRACQLALAGGADFLKTSTGFAHAGANVEDVSLLRDMAGSQRGVKASGGIGTLAFANELVEAGASRLGCSRSVQLMQTLKTNNA
ncbi:MAG: deoxyribose-phosphate aldolase [Planctomycetota bacterium]|jgi:deoxyribose-phosphate aldolase